MTAPAGQDDQGPEPLTIGALTEINPITRRTRLRWP